MANSFCRFLSNGFKINIDANQLVWKPCCFYSKQTPLLNQPLFDKEFQYTSTATDWLPECEICRKMEESGTPGLSPRLVSFKKIPNDAEIGECSALEINVDLFCNAACLSCGPYASSTWGKYEKKHKLPSYFNSRGSSKSSTEFFEELISKVDLSRLQNLYILGGEPLYGETNLKILNHVCAVHKAVNQVTLEYQTNGSIIPEPEVLELWKNFKTVNFSMSIDGINQRFDYLRWPLKWYKVERTVDFLLNSSNVMFDVNATVNPLNVWYFDEIENWVTSTIPSDRLTPRLHNPVRANRCQAPLNLNLTPAGLRADIVLKYGLEHKLSKIFSNLEFNNLQQRMFDYIDTHDKARKLHWKNVFPDVVKYF